MATLIIDDKKAREIYPGAPDSLKAILEQTFGGKKFFEQKITDRVKTFEDVLQILGESFNVRGGETADEIAYRKLKLIARCLNEGWSPDWNDEDQEKYYPWFYMDSDPGFGLGSVRCHLSVSDVGSRLCFKTEALAKHAVNHFLDIYKNYFTL